MSYHAAQTVTRTIKLKKPSRSLFFEERKSDARYDGLKNAALTRIAAKRGISGEKALALFNSDNYDSDGDGVSNLVERIRGDSSGNDSGRQDLLRSKQMTTRNTSLLHGTTPTTRHQWEFNTSSKKVQTAEPGLLLASNSSGLQWTWAAVWNAWSTELLLPLLQVPPGPSVFG